MPITADGTVVQTGGGNGITSQAVTPSAIGDSFVFFTILSSSVVTCTGASAGKYKITPIFLNQNGNGVDVGMFLAVATATGADTINVTYSASVTGIPGQFTGQKFTAGLGAGTQWALDGNFATVVSGSSTTIPFPTVTTTGASRLGIGIGIPANTGSAGSTTGGYVWQTDTFTDEFVYNLLVNSPMTIPSGGQSPTGTSFAIAALLSACRPVIPRINSYAGFY